MADMKSITRIFIIMASIFLQTSCISMDNSEIIDHYFQPRISNAFIYRVGDGYALKVVLSDFSEKANSIEKAKIIVDGKEIDYRTNEKGLETKIFTLKSEKNIKSYIEIKTVLGKNNPIILNRKLTIAPSVDFDLAQDIIQPNHYKYRSALVIGNSLYGDFNDRLSNPQNDAKDIAKTLRSLNFEVIEKVNLSATDMKEEIKAFSAKLKRSNEVRVFYYAGHGFELNNENYMLPIDGKGMDSVSLNDVLNSMGSYDNVLNITILDTCRNNFYSEKVNRSQKIRTFFAKRSLAQTNRQMMATRLKLDMMSSGTIKAFSTASSKPAYDGIGRNGIYTRFLIKHMKDSDISVETLLKLVSKEVQDETKDSRLYNEVQIPWVESSYIGNFSFATY